MQSNSELIDAVCNRGNTAAFTTLVQRYERLVWTICWSVLGDFHATQDVTQETFLIAHRRLRELRDPESLGSWISSIARREALRTKGKQRMSLPVDDIEVIDPQRETTLAKHDELLQAVSQLPVHEQNVIVLRYLNGHSVAEVAELTQRPIGTVTKQLSRAVSRLKSKLAQGSNFETINSRGSNNVRT